MGDVFQIKPAPSARDTSQDNILGRVSWQFEVVADVVMCHGVLDEKHYITSGVAYRTYDHDRDLKAAYSSLCVNASAKIKELEAYRQYSDG